MADQQANQAVLAASLADNLPAAWDTLDISNLEETMPTFTASVAALVNQYGRTSAVLAAKHYVGERTAAGIAGRFTVKPQKPPNFSTIDTGVRWATKGLWSETPDIDAAKSLVQGVAQRGVLDTGRNTMLDAIAADKKCWGWARITEPKACSFCILLATRGAVYRDHSFTNANFKFKGPGAFKTHNNCECVMQPVFGIYEPSAELRRYQALYQQAAHSARGPKATREAFRQLVEADRAKK